jgi:hypothetical protein
MMADATSQLRRVNQKLEDLLENVGSVTGDALLGLAPDQFADLLSQVVRPGELIAADNGNTVAIGELRRYRGNLERLQQVLPLLEVQLHIRRACLDAERAHLEAASDWATTSKVLL